MAFLQYTDKSSLDRKYSRYVLGGKSDSFVDAVGFWTLQEIPRNQLDDITITITKIFEKRADLISAQYYGRTDLEWLILQYNYIVDINEELVSGTIITIPSPQRVFSSITPQPIEPNVITN